MNLKHYLFAKLFGTSSNGSLSPTMFDQGNETNITTYAPNSVQLPLDNLTELRAQALSRHFSLSDNYRLIESSVCEWGAPEFYPNINLPLLKEITFDSEFCPVLIMNRLIFIIGALEELNTIISAVGIIDTKQRPRMYTLAGEVVPTEDSPNKLYDMHNPGFIGSEVLVYSYDGNIGLFTAQSTLNRENVVSAFKYVLELAYARKDKNATIVYTGDHNDPVIEQLIRTVNATVPVFAKLDFAVKDAIKDEYSYLSLDEGGCPVGQQSKISKIQLQPFACSQNFPIYGITAKQKDYGFEFEVTTNRWFIVDFIARRPNGTLAEFSLRFFKTGLQGKADYANRDIIAPAGINGRDENANSTYFELPYTQFIKAKNPKPYNIRIRPEILKFGFDSDATIVEIKKQNDKDYKRIGFFLLYGQLTHASFCGFAPENRQSVKGTQTTIANLKSLSINTGLQYKPS